MNLPSPGPLIAQGRTAEVFAWQPGQILKLFYEWCPPQWVQQEAETSRMIAALALPTPRPLDTVTIGPRSGIIYERVTGPSMLRLSNSKPWLLFRLARQLAELHTLIHRQSGAGLPSLSASLDASIRQAATLPPDLKSAVLRLLAELPDDDVLCHCDFHPDQVIVTAEGPVVLDWMTAHRGNPLADVSRTAVLFTVGQVPYGSRAMHALVDLWRGAFLRTYLARYLELRPGVTPADIKTWMIPAAAGRMNEGIPGEAEALLRLIRSSLPPQAG